MIQQLTRLWSRISAPKPEAPAPVRPILRDPAANERLLREGIVTVPLLTREEVAELKALVASINATANYDNVHIPTPFVLSAFNNDSSYKQRLYDGVHAFLQEKVAALLEDYTPLVINVFEKLPVRGKGNDAVAIHQNPSFVEEPYYKSVSVWIPLVDVRKENGTLGVLRGSQNTYFPMRAANMPDIFEAVSKQLQDVYFEPLVLPAGEAAVLDDSVIHWSYPNCSEEVRTAVQLIMVPKEARHIYYYYNEQGAQPMMELYDVDKNFFFKFNCKEEPIGLTRFETRPFRYFSLKEKEMIRKANANHPAVQLKKNVHLT